MLLNDDNLMRMNIELKDTFENNILNLQSIIQKNKREWTLALTEKFQQNFFRAEKKKDKNKKGKLRYITFSVLLTSILTGKYSLGINFYDEKFYLDEAEVFGEFELDYISDFVSKDMEAIKTWLRNKQILYNESDLFEMKKVLALNYTTVWVKELKDEILCCLNKSEFNHENLADKINVTFGSYLEKQASLFIWEVGL